MLFENVRLACLVVCLSVFFKLGNVLNIWPIDQPHRFHDGNFLKGLINKGLQAINEVSFRIRQVKLFHG